jgi:hypothetical protein
VAGQKTGHMSLLSKRKRSTTPHPMRKNPSLQGRKRIPITDLELIRLRTRVLPNGANIHLPRHGRLPMGNQRIRHGSHLILFSRKKNGSHLVSILRKSQGSHLVTISRKSKSNFPMTSQRKSRGKMSGRNGRGSRRILGHRQNGRSCLIGLTILNHGKQHSTLVTHHHGHLGKRLTARQKRSTGRLESRSRRLGLGIKLSRIALKMTFSKG